MTLLEQREVEAKIIGPIFEAFANELGRDRAREIIAGVIANLAEQGGCAAAARFHGQDLQALGKAIELWRAGNALELDILQDSKSNLDFNVTRCQFAEMYHRLGLSELGAILSCNRDAAMIVGFNPEIQFSRTQTILSGADHCNFRYSLKVVDKHPS
jgi:hypothetical protein